MEHPVVRINTSSFGKYDDAPLRLLQERGIPFEVNPYGRKLTAQEVVDFCRDATGIIAGTEPLGMDTLAACAGLQVISRCGVGMDNVDAKAAQGRGIRVFNTPDAPTQAVGELTVGFILNLLRDVGGMDRAIREGRWAKRMGSLLSSMRVGIIGFGRIGRRTAELLLPFGCELAYFDPVVCGGPVGVEGPCRRELLDLLGWADLVSLHVSTSELVLGPAELDCMRPGAWLVNVSRGGTVDEEALHARLADGRLAGAALDVFDREPYAGPLAGLDNVILTPHIGSYAKEGRVAMELEAVVNLLKGLGYKV